MMNIQRVLVATDFSPAGQRAVQAAKVFAGRDLGAAELPQVRSGRLRIQQHVLPFAEPISTALLDHPDSR